MAKIYTVSELTGYIKALLERDAVLAGVWVKGEISNFTRHSSGHMYFTLKDEQARLRCVMFRTENRLLQFQPADGMAVLVAGRVAVYPKSGEYQLYVEQMEVAGLGSLYLAFEELKKRLAAEGLFDPARKKPLPVLPKKIGVITSPTGAAVRDIIRIARRRFPSVDLLVIPAQVQGEQAAPSISQALRLANTLSGLDLLIVGRGGGSIEELWAFNEEVVARAIAASRIPVISAVGHETDFTIADMVADLRAPTPSGAAELAVPELRELRRSLLLMTERLKIAGLRVFERKRDRWAEAAGHPALLKPQRWLDIKRQRVDEAEERLARAIRNLLEKAQAVLYKELATLDALSPLATLQRGYSICRREEDGRVVREAGQVNPGEAVRVILSRGELFCTVDRKEEAPDELRTRAQGGPDELRARTMQTGRTGWN